MNRIRLWLTVLCALVGVGASGQTKPETVPMSFVATAPTGANFEPGTKWYKIKNHGDNKYLATAGTHLDGNGFKPVTAEPSGETGYWCLVGSQAAGFQLFNRSEGTSKVLAYTSTSKAFMKGTEETVTAKDFDFVNTIWENYYAFRQYGTANNFVNIDGGSTNNAHLVFWNSMMAIWGWNKTETTATGDNGSAWTFVEVGMEIVVNYVNQGDGATVSSVQKAAVVGSAVSTYATDAPEGYSIKSYDKETVEDGTSTYNVTVAADKAVVEGITLNLRNSVTGVATVQSVASAFEGTNVASLVTGVPTTCRITSCTPDVITVGTTTYEVVYEPDYSFDASISAATHGNTGRLTSAVRLEVAGTTQTISGCQSSSNTTICWDKTAEKFTCTVGATIKPSVTYSGSWLHAYCWVDEGHDGFACTADNTNHTISGDLKAYSFYSFGGADTEGWNDQGTSLTGGSRSTCVMGAFKAPSTPGTYRMRYMVAWNNITPQGSSDVKTNSGALIDVTLEVVDDPIPGLKEQLSALITNVQFGSGLGQYGVPGVTDYETAIAGANALIANPDATAAELQAEIEKFQAQTLNKPKAGQFIRIQGYSSKWVTAEKKTISGLNQLAMKSEKDVPATVFYCYENGSEDGECKLRSFSKGLNLITTFGLSDGVAEGYMFKFGDSKKEDEKGSAGQYNIRIEKSGGERTAYLYDSGNNSSRESTDRNSSAANETAWTVEAVTSLPVRIEDLYASVCLPVATIIPEGVAAWVAGEEADGKLHLSKITDSSVLPAGCPVILEAEEDGTYGFEITTDPDVTIPNNFLGTTEAWTPAADKTTMVLGEVNGVVGLYKYTGAYIPGFKMYYETETSVSNIRVMWNGMITAIEASKRDDMREGEMYDINGQRVMKANGLVIVNGKKYVVLTSSMRHPNQFL